MAFQKISYFGNINSPGALTDFSIEYRNNNAAESIKWLEIFGDPSGSFEIYTKIFDAEKYARIGNAMGKAGFNVEDGKFYRHFHLQTCHLDLIGHYLKTLAQAAPEFECIKQELAQGLNIDLTQPYVHRVWRKEGDFSKTQNYAGGISERRVAYVNWNPSDLMNALILLTEDDSLFEVMLEAKNSDKFEALAAAAVAAGFDASNVPSTPSSFFTIKTTLQQPMVNFINAAAKVFPELNEIKQDYIDGLRLVAPQDLLLTQTPKPIVYNRERILISERELRELEDEAQAFIGAEPLQPRRRESFTR